MPTTDPRAAAPPAVYRVPPAGPPPSAASAPRAAPTAAEDAGAPRIVPAAVEYGPTAEYGPGAYRVYPAGHSGVDAPDAAPDAAEVAAPVFEGFLPPPAREAREDVLRREAAEMLRDAITLDESAVRRVDDPPGVEEAVGTPSSCRPSPLLVVLASVLAIAAVALGVTYGGARAGTAALETRDAAPRDGMEGMDGVPAEDVAPPEPAADCGDAFPERRARAAALLDGVTPAATLADALSPQGRAFRWLVCRDLLSAALLDGADPATGGLPKQAGHGTLSGGDAGEVQVLRRYALATFFYATSEGDGWTKRWNFLAADRHECAWHHVYRRQNFPYGEVDPAGFVCVTPPDELGQGEHVVMSDENVTIGKMDINFRVANNLSGTLPPELGHTDITHMVLEMQEGIYGSLPATIGATPYLKSLAIIFMAPHFGGVLPPSIFTSPALEWLSLKKNEGDWTFPPAIDEAKVANSSLLGLTVGSTRMGRGMSGTIPPYITQLRHLQLLNFVDGSLEGTLPDALGDLTSLKFLNLHGNNLGGTLPPSLARLSSLTTAAFGENAFSGTLPAWLGNLTGLRLLDLGYNRFQGTLPAAFSQLKYLEHLSLQRNADLHGPIDAFAPLERLSSLVLNGNHFSSSIPAGLFSNFTGEIFADFGHNNFTGTLPPNFSRWAENTTYLATMRNNFDAGAINDTVCEQVFILQPDCSSSSCSTSCCHKDSTAQSDRSCNYDLDFFKLTGLECDEWWMYCNTEASRYDPKPVD